MRTTTLRAAMTLAVFLSVGAFAVKAKADEVARAVYQKTVRSSALIVTEKGTGTAWVVDRPNKLLITNHHVVKQYETVMVVFPEYRDGRVIAEQTHYQKNARPVRGRVIDSEIRCDLAMIQVESLPDGVGELKLAGESASPGDRVHSVGNPNGTEAMWIYTSGTVRAVYHKKFRSGSQGVIYHHDTQVVETQSPTNPGDSGGPLVNDRGELVAVTQSGTPEVRLMSIFIDVSEVKAYSAEVRRLLKPRSAADYTDRGFRHHESGRYGLAIADYNRALEVDARSVRALNNRAVSHSVSGRYPEAVADLTKAITLDGGYTLAYRNRAWAYRQTAQHDKAIADYAQVLKLEPKNVVSYTDLGVTYLEKGDFDRAAAESTRALEIDANATAAYSLRGQAHFGRKDYDAAIRDFSSAIRLQPDSAWLHNIRGLVLMHQQKWDTAMEDFVKAIERDPQFAAAYNNVGWALLEKGALEDSVRVLTRALEIDPNLGPAYKNRSIALRRLGHTALADADLEKAVRLDPKLAN